MPARYLPIRDYAVIAGLLDDERGGRFARGPEDPHEVPCRYLPDTNVLETTFTSARGAVRVTDALTQRPAPGRAPPHGYAYSSGRDAPLLEPPECMLLNYGRATPVVTVLAHVAYGAIIGFLIGSAP